MDYCARHPPIATLPDLTQKSGSLNELLSGDFLFQVSVPKELPSNVTDPTISDVSRLDDGSMLTFLFIHTV